MCVCVCVHVCTYAYNKNTAYNVYAHDACVQMTLFVKLDTQNNYICTYSLCAALFGMVKPLTLYFLFL